MDPTQREPATRCCDWDGCRLNGLYRAPQSRSRLNEYWWFCLDHVRLYNATWNYYAGMSESEVEADIRRDTVWQRPTWPLGSATRFNPRFRWHDNGFGEPPDTEPTPPTKPLSPTERALLTLDLTPPVTVSELKQRYKVLVKRYHPDVNGGDKAAEEQFKVISEAYRTVLNSLSR